MVLSVIEYLLFANVVLLLGSDLIVKCCHKSAEIVEFCDFPVDSEKHF